MAVRAKAAPLRAPAGLPARPRAPGSQAGYWPRSHQGSAQSRQGKPDYMNHISHAIRKSE